MRVIVFDATGEAQPELLASTRSALRRAGRHLSTGPGDVAVRMISAVEMTRLNDTWRGKTSATDVLSFPSESVDPAGTRHIGDIAICLEVARTQAAAARMTLGERVAQLAIHGLLHLLGYDHETDDGEMVRLEEEVHRTLSAVEGA